MVFFCKWQFLMIFIIFCYHKKMVLFVNDNFSIFFNVLKIANVRPLVCQKRPYNPTDVNNLYFAHINDFLKNLIRMHNFNLLFIGFLRILSLVIYLIFFFLFYCIYILLKMLSGNSFHRF